MHVHVQVHVHVHVHVHMTDRGLLVRSQLAAINHRLHVLAQPRLLLLDSCGVERVVLLLLVVGQRLGEGEG